METKLKPSLKKILEEHPSKDVALDHIVIIQPRDNKEFSAYKDILDALHQRFGNAYLFKDGLFYVDRNQLYPEQIQALAQLESVSQVSVDSLKSLSRLYEDE